MLTSMFGILVLKNAQRITSFFWAGSAISGAGAAIILAFRLGDQATDLIGLVTLLAATVGYSLASISIAVLLQFFLAQTLGLTTTLQLIEISRPDHPLLQYILRNAPGTYQHSLQIANLAEQAAELINADTLLTRVGALYHDSGKARHPHYFIENQVPGSHNPHDSLTPFESAAAIIRHVPDGAELIKKYKLPQRIQDFALEHHGTLITRYQYVQAIEAAGGDKEKVDIERFRYPGPRPQSVETALVMLADGVEARTRAEKPENDAALRSIVEESVKKRLEAGQLDDTDLTMHDINIVIDSFIGTLKGIYHPRIKYPELDEETQPHVQAEAE
jgi:putative nucleotidyltransferase with HDIG domain